MKIVFLCGSHARHMYIARRLYDTGYLEGLIIENRGQMIPTPPPSLNEIDKTNFIRHFADRDAAEQKFFEHANIKELKAYIPILNVEMDTLNGRDSINFLKNIAPDLIISYGVHKIDDTILDMYPNRAWNIHGGLSPWFKGNITLFWPFYFLRPNWAGMTIHHLSDRMDGGDIIHHSVPVLSYGDGLHDVACKAVTQVGEDICIILEKLKRGEALPCISQETRGKLFVGSDWTAQHLRLVYNVFDNDMVDKYLDGEISSPNPELVRAF